MTLETLWRKIKIKKLITAMFSEVVNCRCVKMRLHRILEMINKHNEYEHMFVVETLVHANFNFKCKSLSTKLVSEYREGFRSFKA